MPGAFDNTIVTKVQQANDIVDVISEHVNLKKRGREMVGLCPFHDDHRPSLNVNPDKQIFKCFACGAGGDVLKFVQMRENLTFPQAIQRLAQRAGIKLKPSATTRTKARTDELDPNRLAKLNAWAADHFQKNLEHKQKGAATRDYLAQRKIKPDSIKKWQLGLALSDNALIAAANKLRIPLKLLEQAGLVVNRTGSTGFADKFINRLIFPIADVTGRVIGFGGRTLDGTGAKYLNSPATALFDKSNALYGLNYARNNIASSGTAVVVEGYTDCIMAHQFGCANVVATLGTSLTAGHARILRRYAKEAILLFDSDTAGIEAANRALEVCLLQRIDIKLAQVPEGKDPCDFLLAAGKQQFEKLLTAATDVLKFKWARLKDRFDTGHTLADKRAAVDEFLQAIAAAMWTGNLSAIDRGLVVNRLSTIIPLDGKQINAELSRKAAALTRIERRNEDKKVPALDLGKGLAAAAQREILEVLLNQPSLFERIKQKITPAAFDVPILAKTANVLFETISNDPDASLKQVLAGAEDVSLGNCIVELAQAGAGKGNFEARLTAALDVILRLQKRKKIDKGASTKTQTRFLRDVHKAAAKQNPHSIGMT